MRRITSAASVRPHRNFPAPQGPSSSITGGVGTLQINKPDNMKNK